MNYIQIDGVRIELTEEQVAELRKGIKGVKLSDVEVGDSVSIIDGPFKGMVGTIDTIDKENNRLNILIDLFGQETPVEVELYQVSKI